MKNRILLIMVMLCTIFASKIYANQEYEVLTTWNFSPWEGAAFAQSTDAAKKINNVNVFPLTTVGLERFLVQGNFEIKADGLYNGGGGHRYLCITDMKKDQIITFVASTTNGGAGSPTFNLFSDNAEAIATEEINTYIYKMTADGTLDLNLARYYAISSIIIESPVDYEITSNWNFSPWEGAAFAQSTDAAKKINNVNVFPLTTVGLERFLVQGNFEIKADGLYNGGGGHRYLCITDMKKDQIITFVASTTNGGAGSPTFNLFSDNAEAVATEETNTYIYKMTADGTLDLNLARYYAISSITIESKSGAVIEPKLSISGVQGTNRLVQMKSDTPDAVIKYAIGDSKDFTTYTDPVLINDTTAFAAYTEKNGKQSVVVYDTIAAGTTIAVNAPVITLVAVKGTSQTFSISSSNNNILLTPTSVLTYTLPDGSSAEYAEPLTIGTSGKLTVVASAEGYDSAEASVYVDSKVDWIVTGNYDFTNWEQATIDRMITDSIWKVAYTEDEKLANITRSNPYIWCDSTSVAEFDGLTIGYGTMILYFDAEGKCTGLYNESSGGRDVIVSGVNAGQFVEYIVDGTSHFVKAAGNTCTYNQSRYTRLQKINVYTPDMIIDADTRQLTTSVAGSVVVNYDATIDVEQTSTLSALNEITLVRAFGENYTSVVFPYAPASIKDENDNVLTIGQDIILKEWNTTNQAFADASRIIASRGYVLKVSEALIGKPISFVSVSKTAVLGMAKSNQNKPASGVAFRNNQILSQENIEGTTYAINDLGTAFVKVTDATYAPYTSFFMVADDAIIENDEILIDIPVVSVDDNFISAIEIIAVKGGVIISSADETLVQIYSADGTLVNKLSVIGSQEVALISGLYIINGEKVMVK